MKCKACNGQGRIPIDHGRFELVCGACKGTGEMPAKNNFDRITASPEALASWLNEHESFCNVIPCWECSVKEECSREGYCDVDFSSNAKRWLAWLKQESE